MLQDPTAASHREFGFSRGFMPDAPVNPYLKLLPMLMGIGSPGTIQVPRPCPSCLYLLQKRTTYHDIFEKEGAVILVKEGIFPSATVLSQAQDIPSAT